MFIRGANEKEELEDERPSEAGRKREGEGVRRECGAPRMQIAATNT